MADEGPEADPKPGRLSTSQVTELVTLGVLIAGIFTAAFDAKEATVGVLVAAAAALGLLIRAMTRDSLREAERRKRDAAARVEREKAARERFVEIDVRRWRLGIAAGRAKDVLLAMAQGLPHQTQRPTLGLLGSDLVNAITNEGREEGGATEWEAPWGDFRAANAAAVKTESGIEVDAYLRDVLGQIERTQAEMNAAIRWGS